MLFLLAQILFIGVVVLGLYALHGRLGLGPLFVFVAATQFLQQLLMTTVQLEIFDGHPVSPGSVVLFSSTLFIVLLVYLMEDVETTRRLIYGIVLANLTLALVATTTAWAIEQGLVFTTVASPSWFESFRPGAFLFGTLLLVIDTFLLLVLYEVLRSRIPALPTWARIAGSLTVVLILDTLAFTGYVFTGDPRLPTALTGNIAGKGLAGVLYGLMLAVFIARSENDTDLASRREIRDPLSIFTLRRRYSELRLRATRLGQVLDGSVNEVYTFHPQTLRFLDVNAAACTNLGYSRQELTRMTPLDLAPELTPERFDELLQELRLEATDRVELSTRHRRRDGSEYPVDIHLQLVSSDEPVFLAVVLDTTERQQVRRQLVGMERRYRELFDGAPILDVLLEDCAGELFVVDCNTTFLEELSYSRHEVVGRPLAEFYGRESAFQLRDGGPETGFSPQGECERQLRTRDGRVVESLMVAIPARNDDGEIVGMRAMYTDITALKRAEEESRRNADRLRELTKRLEEVREEERKTIAREIHDDLGQALTGLRLDLSWLSKTATDESGALRQRLNSMTDRVDQSLEDVKDLSARLRPAALDDLGLEEAIRWQAREFTRRFAIECVVQDSSPFEGASPVPDEIATHLFRILQEAMTNVLRHADADRVEISLARPAGWVELEVADNGRGVDVEDLFKKGSLGVLGMRERVDRLGGLVEIVPRPTRGTLVRARVPL